MRTFYFILFMIFYTCAFAQNYGDNNARWIYDFSGGPDGITKVESVKDTIVGTRNLKIFNKTTFYLKDEEVVEVNREPVFIYSNNSVIEFSVDLVNFDTLFNFGLPIGGSWSIPERHKITGDPTGDVLTRIVIDTFTLLINDVPVFGQGAIVPGPNNNVDTIFQDFGSRYSYILPFENFDPYGEGSILRCFMNDDLGSLDFETDLYELCPNCTFSDFEYDCNELSSLAETPTKNSAFVVFPNPVLNTLHIQSDTEQITQVDIYNLNGHLILQEQADHVSTEIDLGNLAPGMYYVLINEKYFEKVVVVK